MSAHQPKGTGAPLTAPNHKPSSSRATGVLPDAPISAPMPKVKRPKVVEVDLQTVEEFLLLDGKPAIKISEVLILLRSSATKDEIEDTLLKMQADATWHQWLAPVLKKYDRRLVDVTENVLKAVCGEAIVVSRCKVGVRHGPVAELPGWSIKKVGLQEACLPVDEVMDLSPAAINEKVDWCLRFARSEPAKEQEKA